MTVARRPDHGLDLAYAEAAAQLAAMADFYILTIEEMMVQLSGHWDDITILGSPLQNLALLRDVLGGEIDLSTYSITNDIDTLMAVLLGVASDKVVPITVETAYAVSVIFDIPLTEVEATELAEAAELIRQAVVEGHG